MVAGLLQSPEQVREHLRRLQLALPSWGKELLNVLPSSKPQFYIQVEVISFPSDERNGGSGQVGKSTLLWTMARNQVHHTA